MEISTRSALPEEDVDTLSDGRKQASSTFPFLLLPGEIRNQIYILLLTSQASASGTTHRSWPMARSPSTNLNVSIFQVCRQLHEEAVPYLYTVNRFEAHPSYLSSLPYFIDGARPITSAIYAGMIRRFHISVRLDCDPYWTRGALCAAFTGVEELEVEAWQSSFGTSDYSTLEPFTEVRDVGKASVTGSVREGYARWLEHVMESKSGTKGEEWHALATKWDVWSDGTR